MTKRSILIGLVVAVVLLTGCIDTTTNIAVRKDGSGIVTETIFIDQSVMAIFSGLGAQLTEGMETETISGIDEADIAKYIAKAEKMGEGVKYVSAKEVTGKQGLKGVEVVYSFDDIEKLNIKPEPENPMGDQMAGMMDAEPVEEVEEEEEEKITFEFKKGGTSTLFIHMPKEEKEDVPEDDPVMEDEAPVEPDPMGVTMMKNFLKGFRIRVMISMLDGKIQKTNASFKEKLDGKDTITLLDVALGKILADEKYAKEFEKMSKIKDMGAAMEAMQKIPGLKIETNERVEIRYR